MLVLRVFFTRFLRDPDRCTHSPFPGQENTPETRPAKRRRSKLILLVTRSTKSRRARRTVNLFVGAIPQKEGK